MISNYQWMILNYHLHIIPCSDIAYVTKDQGQSLCEFTGIIFVSLTNMSVNKIIYPVVLLQIFQLPVGSISQSVQDKPLYAAAGDVIQNYSDVARPCQYMYLCFMDLHFTLPTCIQQFMSRMSVSRTQSWYNQQTIGHIEYLLSSILYWSWQIQDNHDLFVFNMTGKKFRVKYLLPMAKAESNIFMNILHLYTH